MCEGGEDDLQPLQRDLARMHCREDELTQQKVEPEEPEC